MVDRIKRTAVITGAAEGIGRVYATRLADGLVRSSRRRAGVAT